MGLGLGTAFGLMASSDKNNADCDSNGFCKGSSALNDAHSHATVSTVGFVAGVLVAAGVGLVIWGPKGGGKAGAVRAAPVVIGSGGGVVVGGAF